MRSPRGVHLLLCAPPIRSLRVHGIPVELDCSLLAIYRQVSGLLGRLDDGPGASASAATPGFPAIVGAVRPYIASEVLPHLSNKARRVDAGLGTPELYREGERYWLVDDRWGIAQVNLLKGQWRSWVLPRPRLDQVHCAERAVLWPLAQLLRPKGLHLLPAISAVRDGRGVLILCPFSLEPELTALIRGGWRIIGQRWTAVREEDGMPVLLHVPWRVECETAPCRNAPAKPQSRWIDLTRACFSSPEPRAVCQTVLVVQPGAGRAPTSARWTASAPPRSCGRRGRSQSSTPAAARARWPVASHNVRNVSTPNFRTTPGTCWSCCGRSSNPAPRSRQRRHWN